MTRDADLDAALVSCKQSAREIAVRLDSLVRHVRLRGAGFMNESPDPDTLAYSIIREYHTVLADVGIELASLAVLAERARRLVARDAADQLDVDGGTTEPATLDQYIAWLRGYIASGGRPTHFYDYPFTGFEYATSDIVIDGVSKRGVHGRMIIVPAGLHATTRTGRRSSNGWGHTKIFCVAGFWTNDPATVPVYVNDEFEPLLTDEHRALRDAQRHSRHE